MSCVKRLPLLSNPRGSLERDMLIVTCSLALAGRLRRAKQQRRNERGIIASPRRLPSLVLITGVGLG